MDAFKPAKQTERVLNYMRLFGSITPLDALRDLSVMRLASRISDLRKQGYRIRKSTASSHNMYGEKVTYAKYSLEEETCLTR